MRRMPCCWYLAMLLSGAGLLGLFGCQSTPADRPESGPAPLRMPPPDGQADQGCYEDSLTGAHVFEMYCSSCHNARPLAERPFSNYKNVAQHMRVRANLTGKEYAALVAWLRRWHDVPPPNPPPEPSPKRLIFTQPIHELRDEATGIPAWNNQPGAGGAAPGQPGAVPAVPGK
jgi:hypothetical protein